MGQELTVVSDTPAVRLGTAEWTESGGALSRARPGAFLIGVDEHGTPLAYRDDGHVAMVCRTRGGKGVSLIVPNLLEWPGSAVILDPKGENAMVTARRRASGSAFSRGMGQKVRILDPFNIVRNQADEFTDLKTGFNPMSLIRAGRPESVDIAYRIAASIVDTDAAQDPYFPEAGRDLMKALILHVCTSPDFSDAERNLITVRRYIQAGDIKAARLAEANTKRGKKSPSPFTLLAFAMRRNHAFAGVISDAGARLLELEKSPRTLASVVQTACTALDFLDSPGMRECVSKSGFNLSELKTDPKGTSLYLCLPQRFMETHYRWLRMMVALIIGEMEAVLTPPKSGHQVLTVLDEFPALRRMRVIENAAAQIAGFGIKLVMVMQTLAQVKDIYKDNWETLLANATTKLCFGNDDQFTRQHISNLIGEHEFTRTMKSSNFSESHSLNTSSFSSSGSSYNESMGSSHGVSSAMGGHTNVSSGSNFGTSIGHSTSHGSARAEGVSWSSSNGASDTLHKRLLISPDEVGREFGNPNRPRVLALISGQQPIALDRVNYFSFKRFRRKYDPHVSHSPPPTLAQWPKIEAQEAEAARADDEARLRVERVRREREQRLLTMKQAAEEAAERRKIQAHLDWRRRMHDEREAKRRAYRMELLLHWVIMPVGVIVLSIPGGFILHLALSYYRQLRW